jgi:hypothetical protein
MFIKAIGGFVTTLCGMKIYREVARPVIIYVSDDPEHQITYHIDRRDGHMLSFYDIQKSAGYMSCIVRHDHSFHETTERLGARNTCNLQPFTRYDHTYGIHIRKVVINHTH